MRKGLVKWLNEGRNNGERAAGREMERVRGMEGRGVEEEIGTKKGREESKERR